MFSMLSSLGVFRSLSVAMAQADVDRAERFADPSQTAAAALSVLRHDSIERVHDRSVVSAALSLDGACVSALPPFCALGETGHPAAAAQDHDFFHR